MADQLEMRFDADPDWALVQLAIDEHANRDYPRYEKMWAYFRNPLELVGLSGTAGRAGGWYRAAQEMGLPERIRGTRNEQYGTERGRREVVIENDIGWRVQTMVDFMFGNPVRIESTSGDEKVRDAVEGVLEAVFERSGGIALLQDMALLGHVFGHVDLLVRIDEEMLRGSSLEEAHKAISIEPIDARRGVPIVSPADYRQLDGYAVHFERELNETKSTRIGARRVSRILGGRGEREETVIERKTGTVTEVFGRGGWKRFEDGEEVASSEGSLVDGVPVVHIQNMRQPFVYSGIGEVEALVALQDELNTRLSDRANRVTLQSFQMYLAKGIEGFNGAGVGPGVVWSTDNPDASIERFGGDMQSPSEESHITEIREAMDKVSGVPPLAGGVIRAKLGNLSSGNALRVTLMGLIAKTKRKRVGYGRGIERVCGLVLEALDGAGVFSTDESDRGVRVVWPELSVADDRETVAAAKGKVELGVPAETVIAELGYDRADPGVV